MRTGSRPRRTIVGTLWLGFGLVVLVLALMVVIYYWQVQRINSDVDRVVAVQEPLEEAAVEMQIHTGGIVRAVSAYLDTGDPAYVEEAHDAELNFQIAYASFKILSSTGEGRHFSDELGRIFEDLQGKPYRIGALYEQQQAVLHLFREDIGGVGGVLTEMLPVTIDEDNPDSGEKLQLALDLQSSINRVSIAVESYPTNPDIKLRQEALDAQDDFRQSAELYEAATLSANEASWLQFMVAEFEDAAGSSAAVINATDELHTSLAAFNQSIQAMDGYLGVQVLPWARAQALEASQKVQNSSGSAVIVLILLGIIGVLIGGAAVWVLSRRIVGPLHDLADGASMVGSGRLQHRFSIDAKGEFGHLARSLNQMLENIGRSQEALGESEELAWALLDATDDAVVLTDRQGTILASNEVAAGRFGKSLEQMVDESIYDMLTDAAVASMKAHIAEAISTGKHVHYEDEREGKITDQNIYPIPGGRGEVSRIAIFFRDITVRKWVEDVTEQLARRNQLILEAAGEGIFGLDTQGRATFVNPAAARMLGYKPEELVGQRHHELVHHSRPNGKQYPNQDCPIYAAFKEGKVRTSVDDELFWRKDGTSFPVEYTSTPIIDDGRILGAVVTFRDITGRKQVEQALRDSESKYRSIFESAASLIISVDKDGFIVDCSTRIQKVLGYTQNEIIGRRLIEVIHADERARVEELLKEVVLKGFEYDNHYRMVAKDGDHIDVSMNMAAARDASGQYVRIICMINRMTEPVWK